MAVAQISRNESRKLVHRRIRRGLRGTPERPRLNVFRSLKHIYAQIIDDTAQCTLVAVSSADKSAAVKSGGNAAGAKAVGRLAAERAREKGIRKVVFDRGGYRYHGRVKALADAAREAGLEF